MLQPRHIVRFSECQYYNINHDEDWIRLMATTTKGSYYVELPTGSSKDIRENRAKFKERVMEALEARLDPQELELG